MKGNKIVFIREEYINWYKSEFGKDVSKSMELVKIDKDSINPYTLIDDNGIIHNVGDEDIKKISNKRESFLTFLKSNKLVSKLY